MLARGTPKTPFSLKNFIAGMTHPTPGAPCIPLRCTPAHSSTPGTAAHDRQQRRPCKARPTGTHARTLDTLHRSAPDTRQAAPGRSGRRKGWAACVVRSVKCTISDAIFILIYICIFLCKALDYSDINDII